MNSTKKYANFSFIKMHKNHAGLAFEVPHNTLKYKTEKKTLDPSNVTYMPYLHIHGAKFIKLSLGPMSVLEELGGVSFIEEIPVLLSFFLQLVTLEIRYTGHIFLELGNFCFTELPSWVTIFFVTLVIA